MKIAGSLTIKNDDYRLMYYTAQQSQFVVIELKSGEEIGLEVPMSDDKHFDSKTTKYRVNCAQ